MTLIKWSRPNALNNRNDIYSWPYSIFDEMINSNAGGNASFVPAVNISEKAESFYIEVLAAGFKKEDFKIEAEDGTLRISGEHKEESKEEGKTHTRREFRHGSFSRSFSLPENVNAEAISARYENGVLNIEVPKKQVEQKQIVKEIKIS